MSETVSAATYRCTMRCGLCPYRVAIDRPEDYEQAESWMRAHWEDEHGEESQ